MNATDLVNRKGARKIQEIPAEVLGFLNTGELETVNLTEWLALDQRKLIQHTFPALGITEQAIRIATESIANLKKPTAMSTIKVVGAELYEYYAGHADYDQVLAGLSGHHSDTVRCYATYLIALNEALSLEEKFNHSKALIADHHFGYVKWFGWP